MVIQSLTVCIGGEAGQGLVTIGQILAKSLVRAGYRIVVSQSYQSRIRGGHNTFSIRFSDQAIAAPREGIDLLVAMNRETIELHENELTSDALVIGDESVCGDKSNGLAVPFKALAPGKFVNVAALGVACAVIDLPEELVEQCVLDFFGVKHAEAIEQNRQAVRAAYEWTRKNARGLADVPRPVEPSRRIMLNGNQAIALGALSVGLKFFAFYPMTPATSIALTLIEHAKAMGVVIEQAEDEIAAINMAIGASFAGAPSMVATSGGGFALMTEGISLAGMTETPVVIAVAQRPGPATGLPTRTAQEDLSFVLHAGHGEFPRAIFAPGSVEECFHLARKALEVAEKSQSPVFLLTDQYLADSFRAVDPLPVESLAPISLPDQAAEEPYRRFAITESGVSPRLFPGATRQLVVADSDEHTEDGHITEDLSVRVKMVQKRLRKAKEIRANVVPPDYAGDKSPETLLVCWGSTKGAAFEAVDLLREKGKRAAALHFPQVWPLVPELFMNHLRDAKRIVGVEGNAFGQFARILKCETGCEIDETLCRYDGLPITPEWILKHLDL